MKISNGIKQEYNFKTTYKKLYQKIKEEIKNVVINKYINQIEYLVKKVEKLKKENLLLKNDLIYILKRVLLNKNEYTNISNNINSKLSSQRNIFSSNTLNNASYINNKSYNSFFSAGDTINYDNNYNYNLYNIKNINNSKDKNPKEKRRYSIDDDFKKGNNTSIYQAETSNQINVQNKINYYLNSLYKHNFAEECAAGTTSSHLLNKNQSIYDELFSNKNNRNKNKVIPHLNTDINYKKISSSKGRSNSKKKNLHIIDDNSTRNIKNIPNHYKGQKIKTNEYLRVIKKEDMQNPKNKINGSSKINLCENKSTNNLNTYHKNSRFNGVKKSSRSKFLVNKF